MATGQLRFELAGHREGVRHAIFSPDGSYIVTAASDDTARVWDAATGQLRQQLTGHLGNVLHSAISPDGTYIVTASSDDTARVWDVATGQLRQELIGHRGSVRHAAFNPEGTQIVTASYDGTASVWTVFNDSADMVRAALALRPMFSLAVTDPMEASYRSQQQVELGWSERRYAALPQVAASLVDGSIELLAGNQLDEASATLRQARELNAGVRVPVGLLVGLCQLGLARGRAGDMIDHCREAVTLNPVHGLPLDRLAMASAAVGDLAAARAGFESVVVWAKDSQRDAVAQSRSDWIRQLAGGENPFGGSGATWIPASGRIEGL